MAGEIWSVYGITEDEFIECSRCSEKLENLGLGFDQEVLNCNSCAFVEVVQLPGRICSWEQRPVSDLGCS